LRRLAPAVVQILYAAFGPRLPSARTDLLSDRGARLATYTEYIDRQRAALVQATAGARFAACVEADSARLRSAGAVLEATRARIEGLQKQIAGLCAAERAQRLSPAEGRELGRLKRELESARRRRAEVDRPALTSERLARVEASVRVQVDRELGMSDAVNAVLGPRLEDAAKWEIATRRAVLQESLRAIEADASERLAEAMCRYREACQTW
jgi:hypothetical protein